MTRFALRRGASAIAALVGISVVAFAVLNLLPSDPIALWSDASTPLSAEAMALVREELELDRGPVLRYVDWAVAFARGDLGVSLRDRRPVASLIAEALPWTLLLNLCAVLAIYAVALPFGMAAASSAGSRFDRAGSWLLLALYAVPSFAAALVLQQIFAVRLGILPLRGTGGSPATLWQTARHLILPASCLALTGWAFVARYARAALREARAREFITVARAKGLSRTRAWGHILAGAAVPFITLLAALIPGLAGGSVLIEQIFAWPGVGRLYLAAIEGRDYPVVMALTVLSATLVLLAQLLVDILYMVADPRMRQPLLGGDPAPEAG